MKIVYIGESIIRYAGGERIWVEKINYLADVMGYDVTLITSSQGAKPFSFTLSSKAHHVDLGICIYEKYKYPLLKRIIEGRRLSLAFQKKCRETLLSIKPDIIICSPYFLADIIVNMRDIAPVVVESHCNKNYTFECRAKNPLRKLLQTLCTKRYMRKIEKGCSHLVLLTKGDRTNWNVEDSRVSVIPNIVSYEITSANDYNSHHAIGVGRLTFQKRFDLMIEAWGIVYNSHQDWCLDIYGEGEEYSALIMLIKNYGLENSVHIHPFTNDISTEYLKHSFLILSSEYEGQGLVVVEAMAHGLPCVSFNCPYGPSEAIQNNEDGLLVDNGNVKALADSICWMIEHDNERKAMGERAKVNAQRYRPDNIMKEWGLLFEKIANGHSL